MNKDLNQLKKGVLQLVVLKVLSKHKNYGYEIISEIDAQSNGVFKMKEGTLYPILYRLEDKGFIVSEWQTPERREKAKKYYAITDIGEKKLKELSESWSEIVNAVSLFWEGEEKC